MKKILNKIMPALCVLFLLSINMADPGNASEGMLWERIDEGGWKRVFTPNCLLIQIIIRSSTLLPGGVVGGSLRVSMPGRIGFRSIMASRSSI